MVFDRIILAVQFWWKNLLPLLLISLPFAVVGALAQVLFGDAFIFEDDKLVGANFPTVAAILLVQVLAEGALICQLDALSKGRPRSLLDCLVFAVYVMPRLAACMLLAVMPLVVAVLMAASVASGPAASLILLFVLPGIWGYLRLSLATFSTALARLNPLHALTDSLMRTRAQQWPLLTGWMLAMLLALMAAGSLTGLINAGLGDNGAGYMINELVQRVLGVMPTVLLFQAWRGIAPPPRS